MLFQTWEPSLVGKGLALSSKAMRTDENPHGFVGKTPPCRIPFTAGLQR